MKNKLKFLMSSLVNLFPTKDSVFYISEIEDWVIKDIGKSISEYSIKKVKVGYSSLFIRNSVIHFGSLNTYLNQPFSPHKSNKLIVTWYHIPNSFDFNESIKEKTDKVDVWITSNSLTKSKLIKLGIPQYKIELVPLAVESFFSKSDKKEYKNENKPFVIGSFLKDGSGWGEGIQPKYVKGPDLLVKTLIELNKRHEIMVKLSGPSRGFVISSLKENNIQFEHNFFENKNDLIEYYKTCDICLITSREEGGPLSLLESMALGIPVISTKVGMAVDLIENGHNGHLLEIDDIEGIIEKASTLIKNSDLLLELANNVKDTKIYNYSDVCFEYDKIYNYD